MSCDVPASAPLASAAPGRLFIFWIRRRSGARRARHHVSYGGYEKTKSGTWKVKELVEVE